MKLEFIIKRGGALVTGGVLIKGDTEKALK